MINLQFLIGKLNQTSRDATEAAAALRAARRTPEVEVEHLLLALLEASESDAMYILRRHDVDCGRFAADLNSFLDRTSSGHFGAASLSSRLTRLLTSAWTLASLEFGYGTIRSAILILALLDADDFREDLADISAEFPKLNAARLRREWQSMLSAMEDQVIGESSLPASQAALDQFTVDLTAAARGGKIDPVTGRESEIRQIMDILTRRRQNNPILTGEAGVGKTAVVEGFALRVAAADVPPALRDVSIRTLDVGLLQAGAGLRGQFEERLKADISEVNGTYRRIIHFIDESHTLIGGGPPGQNDAANLLKPALARGELRTIAATTYSEYRKYFERDAALARRFQVVRVEEPDEARAIDMVRATVPVTERHHGVRILDEAIDAAVRLSHRYVMGRQLPDKAVSVLDTACAKVALAQTTTPPALEDCRRHIELLEEEIAMLRREAESGGNHADRLQDLFNRLAGAETQLVDIEDRYREERRLVYRHIELTKQLEGEPSAECGGIARLELDAVKRELAEMQGDSPLVQPFVDSRAVAGVISAWTGIPAGHMVRDELNTVLNLPNLLSARVAGQDQALEAIARRIRTARAGLEDPGRPTGVFLLVGPSGVGKTETALALADVLYGGERNAVVINMSEYQEAHSVSGLKGSPPGYVGFAEGGVLTEAVRKRPYCVLLLDEMEKAHPDVMELFYQVFDKGKMEDAQGREIDFRNTIILMTSNAGSDRIQSLCAKPNDQPSVEALRSALGPELRSVFKAALLGRMTVIPYYPIRGNVLKQIIELKLEKIGKRLEGAYRIAFNYSETLVDHIGEQCVESENGARSVDQILSGALLPEISRRLLNAAATKSSFQRLFVDLSPSGAVRYTLE